MTILRLKCMRCGNWADLDPLEMYGWGLCSNCWNKHPDLLPSARKFHRWMGRWQKCGPRHPTWQALAAATEERA